MAETDFVCHAVRHHLLALQCGDLRSENGQTFSIDRIKKSNLEDSEWIRRVVVWLEDTKIRLYDIEERKGLKSIEKSVWYDAVRSYVRQLQCPVHFIEGNETDVGPLGGHGQVISPSELLWVLGYAVNLAYDDGAASGYDDFMAGEILNSQIHPCSYVGYGIALSDLDDQPSLDSFEKLCDMLSVKRESETAYISAADVSKCRYRLTHELIPLLKEKRDIAFSLNEGKTIKQTVPLGFSTGNDESDLAALVLRILHIKELRRLQNAIDEAIVKHQDITANPRTDTGRKKKKKMDATGV